ncbi:hypothetical protein KJ359_005962 [Pestalotiopsis sp. 9143b]|nr:hypothetical protein KJ359_005962 [Pestalotiopsis sp. 9143b]
MAATRGTSGSSGSRGRGTSAPRENFQKVVKLPRQNGAPAKDLHRIPAKFLDEFIDLTKLDIQRMIRGRNKDLAGTGSIVLSEAGTKVELFLRYRQSVDQEEKDKLRKLEIEEARARSDRAMQEKLDREAGLTNGLGGPAMASTLWLRFLAMIDTVGLIILWYVSFVYTVHITEHIIDRGTIPNSILLGPFVDPTILFWTIWGVMVLAVVSLYYFVLWFQYKGLLFCKFEIWPRLREDVWPWVRNGAGWRDLQLRWRQRRPGPPSLPRSAESSIWSDCENPAHF